MTPNPLLGVVLHAIGGFAAGSFYAPLKKVDRWAWESYWLVMGVAAWLITPCAVAWLTTPQLGEVLAQSPSTSVVRCMLFGLVWGVGSLTFGLSVRYLGMALGYAVALGSCMVFGTLVPPIYGGLTGGDADAEKLIALFTTFPGLTVMAGIGVCLVGIGLCGRAGMHRAAELADEESACTEKDLSLKKGFGVAALAGLLSAFFAFGLAAGKPIADLSVQSGTDPLFANNAVLVFILFGGFASNALWCLVLNRKNQTFGDYTRGPADGLARNYLLSAIGGVVWYGQFFFYGMGTTKLGEEYDFSSWSIHMAFIIIFSNVWGIAFGEWRGVSRRTRVLVWAGISTLILSTIVIGCGSSLGTSE